MVENIDYKRAIEAFMSGTFNTMSLDEEGKELAAQILNGINSDLMTNFRDVNKPSSDVAGYLTFAQEAVKKVFQGDLQSHAVAESNRQILLAQTGIQSFLDVRKSHRGASAARESAGSAIAAAKGGIRKGMRQMLAASVSGIQLAKDGEHFLSTRVANFFEFAATQGAMHAQGRNLTALDVSRVLNDHVAGDLSRAMNGEGSRCVALYQHGLINFKLKKEKTRKTVEVKEKSGTAKKKIAKTSKRPAKSKVRKSKVTVSKKAVSKSRKTSVKKGTTRRKRSKSESKSGPPAKKRRTASKSPKRATLTSKRGAATRSKKKRSTVPASIKKRRQTSPTKSYLRKHEAVSSEISTKSGKAGTPQEKRKKSESRRKIRAPSKSSKRSIKAKRGAESPSKRKKSTVSAASKKTRPSSQEKSKLKKYKAATFKTSTESVKAGTLQEKRKKSESRRSSRKIKATSKSPKRSIKAKRGAASPSKKKKSTVSAASKKSRPSSQEKSKLKKSKAATSKTSTESRRSARKTKATSKPPKRSVKAKKGAASPSKKKKSTVPAASKKSRKTSPGKSKVRKSKAAVSKKSEKIAKKKSAKEPQTLTEKVSITEETVMEKDVLITLDFNRGVRELCKQFSRNKVTIKRDAVTKINAVLGDICKKLVAKATDSAKGQKELTAEDIKKAIIEIFPENLAQHAIVAHSVRPLCGHK